MTRVLQFYRTYFPESSGGIERVMRTIAHGAVAHGIETTVLSLARAPVSPPATDEGVRVVKARLDMEFQSNGFILRDYKLFRELAKAADVIHYHAPWPTADIAQLTLARRRPSIVTYHSDIVRQRRLARTLAPIRNAALGKSRAIVATSPNLHATSPVLAKFGDKVRIIPIGLADEVDQVDPALVEKWREAVPATFFLFAGVLRYYKGLRTLIESSSQTGIPALILGAGPEETALRAHAKTVGARQVRFLGPLEDPDKLALLSLCKGVAFPSNVRAEAFGLTLLEASMFSKPMVTCEIGTGTSHVNIDGETGFVVPPSDPAAFSAAMLRLVREPGLAEAMGAAARRRYEMLFRAETMTAAYVSLYREVAGSP